MPNFKNDHDEKKTESITQVLSQSTEEITISCYENEVPPIVEAELDQLYQHINSSLSHFAVRRRAKNANTYVVRRGTQATEILLFTRKKGKVRVINEMIKIEPEEIQRFARFIFARFKSVSLISFSLIGKEIGKVPFICQQFDSSEDIVLSLPDRPEAYLNSLSPKMRRNIRYYLRAIERDFPSFRCQAYEREEINEQHIHDIIKLKKINMGNKNTKFGISQEEIKWFVQQAKACGLLTVATIEDRICGGALSMRVGDNYFGQVAAFDPQYNKYSLGILCSYLTICNEIRRGAKESHLCWGRYEYKYRLAGVQRDMASLDIYRSRTQFILHLGTVLKNAMGTYFKQWKIRLLELENETSSTTNFGSMLVKVLRKIKRSGLLRYTRNGNQMEHHPDT